MRTKHLQTFLDMPVGTVFHKSTLGVSSRTANFYLKCLLEREFIQKEGEHFKKIFKVECESMNNSEGKFNEFKGVLNEILNNKKQIKDIHANGSSKDKVRKTTRALIKNKLIDFEVALNEQNCMITYYFCLEIPSDFQILRACDWYLMAPSIDEERKQQSSNLIKDDRTRYERQLDAEIEAAMNKYGQPLVKGYEPIQRVVPYVPAQAKKPVARWFDGI